MSWSGSDRTWVVIEVLVTIIGVVFGIYIWASESEPEFVAYATYFSYLPSPEIRDMIQSIYDSQAGKYSVDIEKRLTDFKNDIGKVIDAHSEPKSMSELEKGNINYSLDLLINELYRGIL